jgi:alkylation response protein AidB-like acyl-CoA dehydrogenase
VREDSGSIFLTGTAEAILDGADADLVLILAAGPDGAPARIVVEPDADGVEVVRNVTWDRTRSLATVTFAGTRLSADRLLRVSDASEEALASHAALGIAADAIGGSEAILATTIDYMKARQQFGKAIGSFQGLKHRVANHKVALVADTALVASAATLAARGDDLAEAEVAGAQAQACSNYVELSRDAIQLHGGIGFTVENACHLYLKRARLNEALFGSGSWHLRRITRHIMRTGFTA